MKSVEALREVIIVGGGLAGLSAAVYLGRALRDTLVLDSGKSLAVWEPKVDNYLGFPAGISGGELLDLALKQALLYHVEIQKAEVLDVRGVENRFEVITEKSVHYSKRLLLATGLYHLPPEICEVNECVGHSMFFCKDCDGYKVQGRTIIVVGVNNEAVEYALGLLVYTSCVSICTNGAPPRWDQEHNGWLTEYKIPLFTSAIKDVEHAGGHMSAIKFADGRRAAVDFLFTTRGDVIHNKLAKGLGAALDDEGQIIIDDCHRTSVPGVYAAGCVTPANCQMIIAAGQGARAAQAINRNLFEESLATHSLRRFRERQIKDGRTEPEQLSTER